MNKISIGIIVVLLGIIAFLLTKDHAYAPTAPQLEQTTVQEASIPDDTAAAIAAKQDRIVVDSPAPRSVVASPLHVRGKARGSWYFEGTFPLVLVDWDGKIIAESFASAQLDPEDPESTWMTEDFVPFEGTIEFTVPENTGSWSQRGALIFRKDNPSGLPEHDDALEIPVLFY